MAGYGKSLPGYVECDFDEYMKCGYQLEHRDGRAQSLAARTGLVGLTTKRLRP